MVGVIVFSPTDIANQEAEVGQVQFIRHQLSLGTPDVVEAQSQSVYIYQYIYIYIPLAQLISSHS